MKKIIIGIMILSLVILPVSYGEHENVNVMVSLIDVTVDGQVVESLKSDYPVIMYNDILYLPLTFNMTKALGIKVTFSSSCGLKIYSTGNTVPLKQQHLNSNHQQGDLLDATLVAYNVEINGKIIEKDQEAYPFLSYNHITYLPLTWVNAVDRLNLKLHHDKSNRLRITSPEVNEAPSIDLIPVYESER